jgi:hypothetical protein
MTLDDPGSISSRARVFEGISPIPAALLKVAYLTILPMSELGSMVDATLGRRLSRKRRYMCSLY